MSAVISEQHRSRPAYIYVRQSTLAQVRHNQESTERQYALRDKALALGWTPPTVRTLDRDLGVSGAQTAGREDFKTLVADVSMGQVGAVFALEVSRLARSNLDWHRLLELCALTDTLVIDADGCYDPADFNDGLLLGLKGTMAQAELHFLRGRLLGGKLNKAQKGELRHPLPVGFDYDDQSRVVMDPDAEVRGAVALAFQVFLETGSAYAVVQRFAQRGLRFPKRAYGGAWDGKLVWGNLTHSRVCGLLKNPCYAGTYTFGRYQYRRQITAQGEVSKHMQRVAMPEWRVNLPAHHEGYITWEEFLANQDRLAKNRTNAGAPILNGPAREGLALLQGLMLCGTCGHALTVRYRGNGGLYPVYLCSGQRRDARATRDCMVLRCDLLDAAIATKALQALKPAELGLALATLQELEMRDQAVFRQWQMRLERAEYEAALAERRYEEVDPAQRLVASTLERRWNEALMSLEGLRKQYAEFEQKKARVATPEQKAKVLALAEHLPRLWNAPTTEARDRKRMLRLLIKDITVEKEPGARHAMMHIRWQGGACADVRVDIPPPVWEQTRNPPTVVARVRDLAATMTDRQIVAELNRRGELSAMGQDHTMHTIKWIRWKYRIPVADLRRVGEMTVKELAAQLKILPGVVYYWAERGIIESRHLDDGSSVWIKVDEAKMQELRDRVSRSRKMQKQSNV
ncbi:MAG TPA: recombinase family protein [Steroidobacteraceae bacterium]|jgi:DNA invertase Pin-like site-specific DNA recombinase